MFGKPCSVAWAGGGVGVPAAGIVLGELLMLASATNADIYSLQQLNTARNCAFTVMAALAFIGYGLYVHHAKRQTEEQFVSALLVTRWHTLLFCSALQLCMLACTRPLDADVYA